MTTASVQAGHALTVVRAALEANGAFVRDRSREALMASCPLHEDANPSLSVTWKPRYNRCGVVLLHCFSCQASAGELVGALGLRLGDLFDDVYDAGRARRGEQLARQAHVHTPTRRITAPTTKVNHQWRRTNVYTYTSSQGVPVQQVIRSECSCSGRRHKRFQQRYREGQRWVYRKPRNFVPVLYRVGVLRAAATTGRPVWITEGEKDADTLSALGQLATTNAQGAASFPAQLAYQFEGLTVIIAADRDVAGYQRAVSLSAALSGVAAHVRVVLPALTDDKADLTDHVAARLWRAADPDGGLIRVTMDELIALHAAAEAHILAGRVRTALAEAAAIQHHRSDCGSSVARWITEAAQQAQAVRSQLRKLEQHNHETASPMSLDAQHSTAALVDQLHQSYRQTYETIYRGTDAEAIA